MNQWHFVSRDVDGARREILPHIRYRRDENVIYFNGWWGFGAAPVLRSVAQELRSIKAKRTPPELCFDRILYIDCSAWESKRVMQRKIAEQLKLDHETMGMFDNQDEEDDFNGVDHGSRDVIRRVSEVIDQTLGYQKIIMVFLNGSDDDIDVTRFGFSPNSRDHVILWTFKTLSLTVHASRDDEIASKLRHTNIYLKYLYELHGHLTSSQFCALLREEAANIVARHPWMRSIDLTMVTECCIYELFLQYSFHTTTRFGWVAHSPNYWTCDGIIKGDSTRKISDTLHQQIHWEHDASLLGQVFAKLKEDPETPFLVVEEEAPLFKKRQCRWVFVNSKNTVVHEDMKGILESASSLFVALETSDDPQGLQIGFLKHCSNLGVLILTCCTFNFGSPPFLQCHGLRFLGLDHCTHDNTSEGESDANWTCLHNLWVLDLRYTEWDEILSEERMDIMANLRELNIEGFMCWQLTSRLHGRLPCLQRLRIIKPTHKAETASIDCNNSSMDKKDLEILDLSGNREMENLSESFSVAKSIQMVILDGCDGLENVIVPDGIRSSLRLFSFDGYGPAKHWTSSFKLPLESPEPKQLPDTDKRDVKTSMISLQGCAQLENLFVHELPNLVELDLSGCAIRVLDFTTMVTNVPMLKRLFLLGCQNLCAIIWRSRASVEWEINLELVCIDTRYKRALGSTRPSLAQYKHFGFQLHAVLADARLARTLVDLITHNLGQRGYGDTYFNIHFTSSVEFECGQLETTGKEMSKPNMEQHLVRVSSRYDDVFFKIGDAPMLVFPQPPNQESDHHIQISDGSHDLESELAHSRTLRDLMKYHVESLHEHDTLASASMPAGWWGQLKWCRIERCPNLGTVFPPDSFEDGALRTIWASDLLKADCIWSKGSQGWSSSFTNLQHLHLRSCPRLQFVLPVWVASFPSLKTIHIIHCGNLTHVFVLNEKYPKEIVTNGVPFPKLTTVHLHDLPKLRQIMCNEVKMLAPALETIRVRGCFGLRRLPALQGREPGVKRPSVEMEKDVWDALEWDGLAAGHHPDLFEPPVHSRYYRQRRLLRRTVLR